MAKDFSFVQRRSKLLIVQEWLACWYEIKINKSNLLIVLSEKRTLKIGFYHIGYLQQNIQLDRVCDGDGKMLNERLTSLSTKLNGRLFFSEPKIKQLFRFQKHVMHDDSIIFFYDFLVLFLPLPIGPVKQSADIVCAKG